MIKIKERQGSISVIVVIFVFILVSMFAGMVDTSTIQFGLKETQGKIDIAGTNALYSSINLDSLRLETLEIEGGGSGIAFDGTGADLVDSSRYESVINTAYRNELRTIEYAGRRPNIRYTKVDMEYSDFGLGYKGAVASKRPQVVLESVVSYTVSSSSLSDTYSGIKSKEIKSSHANSDFVITISETENDGEMNLLIHSTTRIVLK